MSHKFYGIFISIIFAINILACGPVEYMGQVGIKADKKFAAAKEADAKKYSPYEYYSAYYYLNRARYKAGYGDYQDAVKYGEKCEKMSDKAKDLSLERKQTELEDNSQPSSSASSVHEKKPQIKIIVKKEGEK